MKHTLVVSALIAAVAMPALAAAQIPGQNVNMVTGTTFPGGDPYLQKQNEPSIAVSTVNPCHLLAGANDYRAVNLPGLPADLEVGDAWLGLFKSIDCGQTWFSTLVPGYLQDTSAAGRASPVKGLTTGADPTVRAGTGGLFFYSFIAFNRGTNVGKLALARFIDNNNKEAGDPIAYVDTRVIDNGSNGQFIDKPYMTVTPNGGTCTINGRTVPGNTVHAVWSVFLGNGKNTHTKIYYAKSSNCGASLDAAPTKLSEGLKLTQGAYIAPSLDGRTVYIVWRQFGQGKEPHALLVARSTDGGRTFTKGTAIPVFQPFRPFDQGTTAISFRTNAFPTAAMDHHGRLHVAVALRDFASNQSRIVITSTTDGRTWTLPQAVENPVNVDAFHQIMPALTYAGGRLHLLWYDFQDTAVRREQPLPQDFIAELFRFRHTMDVRGARGTPDAQGFIRWDTYGVLQSTPEATVPKVSGYLVGRLPGSSLLHQLQYNMPNLRLYAGGTRPFMGDYLDIAGLTQLRTPTGWTPNTGQNAIPTSAEQTVHAVWTDNRDVRVGPLREDLPYVAPGPACTTPEQASLTGTRNANVYTARITPGLVVLAPGNAKPTAYPDGGVIERAFAVMVQNRTDTRRTFTLTIANQPAPGTASFARGGTTPSGQLLTQISADVGPRSSIARTVYVNSTARLPRIQVNVQEQGGALAAATVLNPDLENPDLENPDLENPDLENVDIRNTEVHNPDLENPDMENPDLENPDLENPDMENPDLENPDLENPDMENPDLENPDLENPDMENPDLENPDLENGSMSDVSFDLTNDGNTTSSYQVKVEVSGDTRPFLFQLIGRRVYSTPTSNGCDLALAGQNQVLFNISNPDLTPGAIPDGNSPDERNATVLLRPGERIKVTLRVVDKDVLAPDDGTKTTAFCPVLKGTCTELTHVVTTRVRAHAPNTGDDEPEEDVAVSIPESAVLAVATESLPPTEGFESVGYNEQLESTGGIGATRTWSLFCPDEVCGGLPPGLTLHPDGVISGSASTPGTYNFVVTVTDGVQQASRALSIVVEDPDAFLTFTEQPPASTILGATFPVTVQARDGTGAALPGLNILLSLADNDEGAALHPPDYSALTNSDGNATFTNLLVNVAGAYRLRASAVSGETAVERLSTPFAVDPVPGILGPVGGSGGTAFGPITCPDAFGAGLRGRAGDDIDRTELWCRGIESDFLAGGIGGDGGVPFDMTCPAGTRLAGIHGRSGQVLWPGVVIDTLGVTCRNIDSGVETQLGPVGNVAPSTTPFALTCPAGRYVTSILGRQGALLDQIALICQ